MSAATEWANKKRVAMENAKRLREERKSGIGNNAEVPTFTPQVNKRPQYLNNTKDTLDIEVKIQSNDVFEQPLPGARGRQQQQQDSGLPSPGSDALGREMKNHPTNNNNQQPQMPNAKMSDAEYKSAFLRQYETEKQLRKQQTNNNTNSYQQREMEPQPEPPYDEFAGMLRSDAGSSGPGWNDDTSSNGFPTKSSKIPQNRHIVKKAPPPSNNNDYQSNNGGYDNAPVAAARASGMQQPSRMRNAPPQQQQQRQQEWNSDSDYMPAAELPPRVSPRPQYQQQQSPTKISPRGGSVASSSNIQHSKLSLLKSKIRNSESSGSSRVSNNDSQQGLHKSSSSSERQQGGAFSDYADNNGTGGRKTAPNATNYGNSGSYQQDNDYSEQPPPAVAPRAGRRGPPPPQISSNSKQQQQADAFKYEQEQYMLQQKQQQQQAPPQDDYYQPSFKGNAPSRQQPPVQQHNSRFDEDDDDDQQSNFSQKPPPRQQPPAKNQQQQRQAPPQQQYQQPPQQQQQQRQAPPQQQYQQPPQQQQRAPAAYDNNMSEYPPGGRDDLEDDMGGADMQPQHECPDCGRKFNAIPFQKHVKICQKVFLQKRKAFDSTKMRVNDNPELVQILNKVKKEEKKKAQQQGKPAPAAAASNFQNKPVPTSSAADGDDGKAKWKEQSNAFREAMKAARVYKQAIAKGEAPPPVVAKGPDMSLIPCNNCGRRFNEKAAERHIPLCKNIIAKPKALKSGTGGAGGVNGAPSAAKGRR